MAATPAHDEDLTELRVSWWVRIILATTLAGVVVFIPIVNVSVPAGVSIPVALALTAAFVYLAGAAGIDLHEDVLVLRSIGRTVVIPWSDVQTIEVHRSRAGTHTVVQSPEGRWRTPPLLTMPGWWPVLGASGQTRVLRAAWSRAGGGADVPPVLRPWGPDPRTLDSVVIRPVGQQALWPGTFLVGVLPFWGVYVLRAAMAGQWLAALGFLAPIAAAMVWAVRRHTVVTAGGVELRRLRTTVVPWSAIRWIGTTRSGSGFLRVRLMTDIGVVDLPVPLTDGVADDPAFERKLDFIGRCWATHRGAAWTAPAPPPIWRPPPPAPPA